MAKKITIDKKITKLRDSLPWGAQEEIVRAMRDGGSNIVKSEVCEFLSGKKPIDTDKAITVIEHAKKISEKNKQEEIERQKKLNKLLTTTRE